MSQGAPKKVLKNLSGQLIKVREGEVAPSIWTAREEMNYGFYGNSFVTTRKEP
jgi:hypothetical protein